MTTITTAIIVTITTITVMEHNDILMSMEYEERAVQAHVNKFSFVH